MYKEYAFKTCKEGDFVRNIIRPEEYVAEFVKEHENQDCYATYAGYDVPDQERSLVSAPLVFDIDSEKDLEIARQEAIKVLDLFQKIGIIPRIYFSGAKGFDLIVPFVCFGV